MKGATCHSGEPGAAERWFRLNENDQFSAQPYHFLALPQFSSSQHDSHQCQGANACLYLLLCQMERSCKDLKDISRPVLCQKGGQGRLSSLRTFLSTCRVPLITQSLPFITPECPLTQSAFPSELPLSFPFSLPLPTCSSLLWEMGLSARAACSSPTSRASTRVTTHPQSSTITQPTSLSSKGKTRSLSG